MNAWYCVACSQVLWHAQSQKLHYNHVCLKQTNHFKDILAPVPTSGMFAFFPVKITKAPRRSWNRIIHLTVC